MRRADFCRAEQTRRRRVAHCPKLSQDGFQPEADVTCDVLNEDPLGTAFADDASNIGSEVPGIIGTTTLASGAEGLAGVSGEDDVEGAAEGASIETAEIIPDWRWGETARALGGDENGAGPLLPFNKSAGVIAGLGEHEAHIKASAACAEGQSMPGT